MCWAHCRTLEYACGYFIVFQILCNGHRANFLLAVLPHNVYLYLILIIEVAVVKQ